MIVAHELGTLSLSREGSGYFSRAPIISKPRAPSNFNITPLTPEQIARLRQQQGAAPNWGAYAAAYAKTVVPGYTVAGATLTPLEKELQAITLRRDFDALFKKIPLQYWKRPWMLGKYSFRGDGPLRRYVPFSKADIRKFIFSDHYSVQPGYTCTDNQREMGVNAHWKAQSRHQQKFGATDWRSNWPIYPGGGYGGQRYGCEKHVPSTWVKIREKLKPIAIAAVVVTGGILLGKALVAKAAASKAASAAAASKVGIVGAGTKAGAAAAITTKATAGALATKAGTLAALKTGAGTAAAVAAAAGGAATGATTAGGIVGLAAKSAPIAENIINGSRTIKALADGSLPPPPISLGDGSLTNYATVVGEQLAERELRQKLSEAEAAMLADMIESERRYLARGEAAHRPVVNSGLDPTLTAAQRTRADGALSEGNLVKILALGVPALLLLAQR